MKTKLCVSLVLILGIGLLASSSAFASGWGWDRDAGAKARGEFGTPPKSKSSRTYSYRSYSYQPRPSAYWQGPYVAARQAFSYEPTPSPLLKSGDAVVVAAENASLMVGDRAVAAVPKGQRLTVSAVEGPWVGTSIQTGGQEIGGWLRINEVAPVQAAIVSPTQAPIATSGCGWRR
jgi:hypothetical protein